jgi:hypothetical protein
VRLPHSLVALNESNVVIHDKALCHFVVLNDDFNGQVGASELAQLAADAVFGPCGENLVLVIELEYRFGAEVHADAASLAPLPVDEVFL